MGNELNKQWSRFAGNPRYRRSSFQIPFILLVAFLCTPLSSQEDAEELPGYELLADRVIVETPDHWRAWQAPTGARLIRPDGTVEPRLLRRRENAVINAETDSVVARISSVGTNRPEAERVIDGDPGTSWPTRRWARSFPAPRSPSFSPCASGVWKTAAWPAGHRPGRLAGRGECDLLRCGICAGVNAR
jgi:hypothetical protein